MAVRIKNVFKSARLIFGVIILFVLFFRPLPGLDPDKPVDSYLVDKWDTADGIPSNTVISITQTPDGYLWIATTKGLVRFDGIQISPIHFTQRALQVQGEAVDDSGNTIPDALLVDREGILWIGSAAGLTSYHHKTRRFHTFTPADGITKDRIRRMKDDVRGNLWISFHSGYVNRFANRRFTPFDASHGLEGKKINTIVEDSRGNLLFGSFESGMGVFIYRDGRFSKYPVPGLDNHQVTFMHAGPKEELWIGTNNGLFRVTAKGTETYTGRDGLSNNYIINIIEDSDRNLWVGTAKGLNRVKRKQDGTIGFEILLESFTINCLFEDREKSLWVGTYDSGIKRLKEGKFTSFAPLDRHPGEMIFSLFQDRRGDTWLGAFGGKIFRCRGKNIVEILEPPELSGNNILAVGEDDRGNLWLGTNGKGVFQKKNNQFIQFTTRDGLADNTVTSIFNDSRGNLWFSTFDGVSLFSFAPAAPIESLTSRNGLPGKRVHDVYEDKNQNIWIGTDNGITVLTGGKLEKAAMKHYLGGVSVTCIYEDPSASGLVWIATHGNGLKRITLADWKLTSITTYSNADGMASDFIYRFFEDLQGNFWLMSKSGILRVRKNELNRYAGHGIDTIHCTSFGTADGLKSLEFDNEFSRHSALDTGETGNRQFWFVTRKGISILNPSAVYINTLSPPVVIEEAVTGPRSTRSTPYRFRFTAPTFLSPEKVKFKYKLEGYDEEWVLAAPGSPRTAGYETLEPGTYTFRVIACNSEGVWNRAGDAVTFTVKPFFYQSFLFKAAVFLIFIILAAVGFYIYRKRPFAGRAKYKGAALNPRFAAECIKKLTHLMEIKKEYRNADISLPVLAKKLSISPHVLSQVLNEKLNRNFADFINSYRVEEAKEIFQGPRGAREKIEMVAYDVGFNTIAAFYTAFKKYTGMTPAQYKKKVKG